MDDDLLLNNFVECLVWHLMSENSEILGLDAKAVVNGRYKNYNKGDYSFMIGKTILFHKTYLDLYL